MSSGALLGSFRIEQVSCIFRAGRVHCCEDQRENGLMMRVQMAAMLTVGFATTAWGQGGG